jgi:hypothetical protein
VIQSGRLSQRSGGFIPAPEGAQLGARVRLGARALDQIGDIAATSSTGCALGSARAIQG